VVRLEPDGGGCVGEVVGFVVVVGEGDSVGLGEGVGVVLGVGAGVGEVEGGGVVFMLAVIVPGPFMVAVVNLFWAFPIVMLPELLDHEVNAAPTLGVTDIETDPESDQRSPLGLTDAVPAGLTTNETKY
jgi:hypothetical protein